jgi:hypothetical protein
MTGRRMTRVLLLAMLLVVPALADEVQHRHPAQGQPDPYYGYKRPDTGGSCCNGQDCRPVESRFNFEVGQTELLIGEEWRALELDKIVGPPPQGADQHVIHACWQDRPQGPGITLCIFMSGDV